MDDYGSAEGWLQSERQNSKYWYAQAESLRADAEKYRKIVEAMYRIDPVEPGGWVRIDPRDTLAKILRIIKEGA